MLRRYHCDTEIVIQPAHRVHEILRRHRVQLGSRLVQQQYFRVERRGGGKAQQLLLSAGKGGGIAPEKFLKPEIACHLPHPAAYLTPGKSHALAGERQFMPHLVRDGLRLRILHYESYGGSGAAVRLSRKLPPIQEYSAPGLAARLYSRRQQT